MAAVNYATQYQQALQQVFKVGLQFTDLYDTPNNNLVKWVSAKSIQVPNISTGGYTDVNRDTTSASWSRNVDNNWIPFTLSHDREFKTLIDPQDIDESNMALTIANITQVFNTESKIPEMDKYMASKLYSQLTANGGTLDNTVLDTTNILTVFDSFMEAMDDGEVPQDGRILYVTPQVNTLLKTAQAIVRRIDLNGGGDSGTISRSIRSLDEVTIIVVPSTRMKSLYDFSAGGAAVDAAAKQINMIMIHPLTLFSPQKYEFVSLDQPTAVTGGKWLYYERKYWDVFLINKKIAGVKINASA
jgi:hypothetical protein